VSSDTQRTAGRTVGRQKKQKNDEGRMPLGDHLRELRNRLVISVLALLVATIIGFVIHNWVYHMMTRPVCDIQGINTVGSKTKDCKNGLLVVDGVLGGLSLSFDISMMVGVILSCPVWSYQLWAFIAPGLHKKERRYGIGFVSAAVPLFLGGAAIAYWVFARAMKILMSFVPQGSSAMIQGTDFLTFLIRMVLVFGISFEIPLLFVGLNLAGILSSAKLRGWWRAIVFIIFVFAAVATPTGDPLTMTVLAVPMCVLFFIAVGVTTFNDRLKEKRRPLEDPDSLLDDDVASSLDLSPSELPSQGLGDVERVTASDLSSSEPTTYHPDDVT
jgi:sec-independent protein translocase protein TatC